MVSEYLLFYFFYFTKLLEKSLEVCTFKYGNSHQNHRARLGIEPSAVLAPSHPNLIDAGSGDWSVVSGIFHEAQVH